MNVQPHLLRTRDAAQFCGFAKSTLEKFRVTGNGPRFIRRGKSVFYTVEDLAAWLANLPRYQSTSEADAAGSRRATP